LYAGSRQQPHPQVRTTPLTQDNSFNAQFAKTGERPQNFIKNVDPAVRYNKYPRMAALMQEKNSWTKKRNHPPVYIKADLETYDLAALGKFDVIYCDPPWEEYERRAKRLGILQEKGRDFKGKSGGMQP
jgi:mRNA (2'-O-methyladenosine-N6-)-methyltransferase